MSRTILALDVGEKRIGVAQADTSIGIAVPYETIDVDGSELTVIHELLISTGASKLVVGYPRNQSGEPTAQTAAVEAFVEQLGDMDADVVFQDESLTSVIAEQQLESSGKPYKKSDIDMVAASLILGDYMESKR